MNTSASKVLFKALSTLVIILSMSLIPVSCSGGEPDVVPDFPEEEEKEDAPVQKDEDKDEPKIYSNPIIDRDWPDPTVWKSGNYFYSIGTGVYNIYMSKDMVNWTDTKRNRLSESAKQEVQKIGSNFWAPDVVQIGDKWMLYLTCYNSNQDCGIAALTSPSAIGPFNFVSLITHSKQTGIKDTIDPEVVYDKDEDKLWLFFGSIGKMHRVELNKEGTALAENAVFEHVAGLDVNDNPSRSKVFEAAYLYYHDGYWYLFASAGLYLDSTYNVVVGRSKTLGGTFVDKEGRKMTEGYATSFLKSEKGDDFFGPGHTGEIFTDKDGNYFIYYHCHQKSSGSDSKRYLMLQQLYWGEDGWPYVEGGKPAPQIKAPSL